MEGAACEIADCAARGEMIRESNKSRLGAQERRRELQPCINAGARYVRSRAHAGPRRPIMVDEASTVDVQTPRRAGAAGL